jgi:hypothetical protein
MMQDVSLNLSRKYDFHPENWREVLKITDRKLIIQVHNTWIVIDNEAVSLKLNKDGELANSSTIKLKNVFIDKNIALVFNLEYQLAIRDKKAKIAYTSVRTSFHF